MYVVKVGKLQNIDFFQASYDVKTFETKEGGEILDTFTALFFRQKKKNRSLTFAPRVMAVLEWACLLRGSYSWGSIIAFQVFYGNRCNKISMRASLTGANVLL